MRRPGRLGSTIVGLVLVAAACARGPRALDVPPGTRLLVVAPHPDDETLAAGGLIQRVLRGGGTVRVVVLTPGDGYLEAAAALSGHATPTATDYRALGDARLRELAAAARTLGLPPDGVTALGYPDDGLAALWNDDRMGHVSPHTGRGPYRGDALLDALERALGEAQPSLVVVPDPRDVHADHAAAGRFAFAALAHASPPIATLTYFVHDPLWPPAPSAGPIMPPPPDRDLDGTVWISLALTPEEQETKAQALRAHRSQWPVLGGLLERFVRANEVFAAGPTAPSR